MFFFWNYLQAWETLKLWYINKMSVTGFAHLALTSREITLCIMQEIISQLKLHRLAYRICLCMFPTTKYLVSLMAWCTQAFTLFHSSVMVCVLKQHRVYTNIAGAVNHWNELSEGETDCVPSERLHRLIHEWMHKRSDSRITRTLWNIDIDCAMRNIWMLFILIMLGALQERLGTINKRLENKYIPSACIGLFLICN